MRAIRAIGYVRVSTDEQALGPAAQRQSIERWAAGAGYAVVSWHEDIGVSGGAALEERPGLLAALESVRALAGPKRALPGSALVVAKRDRLARDPIVSALVERMCERAGAVVVSAAGEGNGSEPSDVLMRRVADAFAEHERLVISARTRAALAVKKSRGERVGGGIPYGYALSSDGVHLVEVEAEQAVIREARELAACGHSLRVIAHRLTSSGILTRAGGRRQRGALHPEQVRRMLLR